MKKKVLVLALILCGSAVYTQHPVIAVIPLRPMGDVSLVDSETATSLLETGLVKSGAFQVVERSRISEVLGEQELSHGAYIDESSAVEVGKLLSAAQIVLGSLSRVGQRYFLTAKIIDVASAGTLAAESIEAPRIDDVASGAVALGTRLAGVRPVGEAGATEPALADLLIHTQPEGAEVFVNGRHRGTSPLLLEAVPVDWLHIEARIEGMYGELDFQPSAREVNRVDIVMNRRTGRLFVRTPDPTVIVRIDDVQVGFAGEGLFPEIPEGEHRVELIGDGRYAQTTAFIRPDETTTVSAVLMPVGALHYRLPEGAVASLTGPDSAETLTGEGWLEHLPTGDYRVVTTMADFLPMEQTVRVERGKTAQLLPKLSPTPEAQLRLTAREKAREREALDTRISELEAEREVAAEKRGRLRKTSIVLYGVSGGLVAGSGASLAVGFSGEERMGFRYAGGALGVGGVLVGVVATILLLERPDLEEIDREMERLRRGSP